MSKKYTYTRGIETVAGKESFTAEQFDSFEEAITAVEKGIRDRKAQIALEHNTAATIIGLGKKEEPKQTTENEDEE